MTRVRSVITLIVSFFAGLFGFGGSNTTSPTTSVEGTSAAAIHATASRLPARGIHQRSGRAVYTKWKLDRAHRNKVNRIAKESRRRNRV